MSTKKRLDARVTAGVGVVLTVGERSSMCVSRNLSRRGVFVLTDVALEPPKRLWVDLVFHRHHIPIAAEVVSRSGEGVGLRFVEVMPETALALDALIGELVAMPPAQRGGAIAEVGVRIDVAWVLGTSAGEIDWTAQHVHTATAISLSTAGAALEDADPPGLGKRLTMRWSAPLASLIVADVVRHTGSGFAVRYVAPSLELQEGIGMILRGEHLLAQHLGASADSEDTE